MELQGLGSCRRSGYERKHQSPRIARGGAGPGQAGRRGRRGVRMVGALRTEGPTPPPGSRVTGVEKACAAGAPATHMSRPVPGRNSKGGAPRLFRCQVVMAALSLTLSASLFPVAQRTSGSTPLRAKPLWRRPASASAPAGNGGALPLLPAQRVTAAPEEPLPASACNGGPLLATSGPCQQWRRS